MEFQCNHDHQIKAVDVELYPMIFPMSLGLICQNWLYSLDPKQIETQEDINIAFMKQYESNTQLQTSLSELEVLKQDENEGFTTDLNRQKDKSTHVVSRPAAKDLV